MAVRTVSQRGLERIAAFEGYRARAVALQDGRHTVGFGHVASARAGAAVSLEDAYLLLRHDLLAIECALRAHVRAPLSQNQFDALASFAFNIGLDRFLASDVLRCLNAGEPIAAALAMGAWRTAEVHGRLMTVDALVRRRTGEMDLFLTPEPGVMRPVAPTPVLRPQNVQDAGARDAPGHEPAPHVDLLDPVGAPPAPPSEAAAPVNPIDQTMAAIRARLQDVGVRPAPGAPAARLAEMEPTSQRDAAPGREAAFGREAANDAAPPLLDPAVTPEALDEAWPGALVDAPAPASAEAGRSARAGLPPLATPAPAPTPKGLAGPLLVAIAGLAAFVFGVYRFVTSDVALKGAAGARPDILVAAIGLVLVIVGAAIVAERVIKR